MATYVDNLVLALFTYFLFLNYVNVNISSTGITLAGFYVDCYASLVEMSWSCFSGDTCLVNNLTSLSLSLLFNDHFPGEPGLAGVY